MGYTLPFAWLLYTLAFQKVTEVMGILDKQSYGLFEGNLSPFTPRPYKVINDFYDLTNISHHKSCSLKGSVAVRTLH